MALVMATPQRRFRLVVYHVSADGKSVNIDLSKVVVAFTDDGAPYVLGDKALMPASKWVTKTYGTRSTDPDLEWHLTIDDGSQPLPDPR